MLQTSRRILLVALGAFTVCLYFCRLQEVRRVNADQAAAYGKFTASQILARSEPIFQSFFPDCSRMAMTAERQKVGSLESKDRMLWAVDCADTHGHHLAYLCWDAETGEIVYASRLRSEAPDGQAAQKSNAEVMALTKDWLYALNIAESREEWRLTTARLAPPSNLHVYWRSAKHKAVVVVDKRTGDFISATNGEPVTQRAYL